MMKMMEINSDQIFKEKLGFIVVHILSLLAWSLLILFAFSGVNDESPTTIMFRPYMLIVFSGIFWLWVLLNAVFQKLSNTYSYKKHIALTQWIVPIVILLLLSINNIMQTRKLYIFLCMYLFFFLSIGIDRAIRLHRNSRGYLMFVYLVANWFLCIYFFGSWIHWFRAMI